MPQGGYAGQFVALEAGELPQVFETGAMIGLVPLVIDDAQRIVAGRSLQELHQIATRIEDVVEHQARNLAKARMASDAKHKSVFRCRTLAEQLLVTRANWGDVDLWLQAGADRARSPAASTALPGVRAAEYFAVIALWKALDLQQITKRAYRYLRQAGTDGPSNAERVHTKGAEAFWESPVMQAFASMRRVAQLSAELARAATLATEAEFLETQLSRARDSASKETQRALEEIAGHRVKEAGAAGGRARAEKYEPLKKRIIELARAGNYRSRNAAAQALLDLLQAEGFTPKFSFVLKTLAAHDRAIEAARASRK